MVAGGMIGDPVTYCNIAPIMFNQLRVLGSERLYLWGL